MNFDSLWLCETMKIRHIENKHGKINRLETIELPKQPLFKTYKSHYRQNHTDSILQLVRKSEQAIVGMLCA